MTPTERDPLDRFNDYLDGLARGREAEERPDRSQDSPDSALSDAARQLRSLDAALAPDPALANRIWEELMNQASFAGATPSQRIDRVAPTALNGRAAPRPWRARSAPRVHRDRPWPLAPLATTALVALVLVASFFVFGPSRPGRSNDIPAIVPASGGTPASLPGEAPVIETLVATVLSAESRPAKARPAFTVWHATIAAGSEVTIPAAVVACCPGPKLEHVLAGEVAVRVDGPLRVERAGEGGTPGPSEEVAPGTEVVLRPGDTAITDFASPVNYANRGAEPVRLIAGGLFASSPPDPPLGYTVDAFDDFSPPSPLPPGSLAVRMLRATLPPRGVFPAPPEGATQVVTTGPDDATLGVRGDGSALNLGRHSVNVYALVLAPSGLPGAIASPAAPPAPPAQPATGPGGADYRFTEVVATDHGGGGKEAEGYWLFEPAKSGPEPLPVVLFLHEQGEGQPPDSYRAWIDHLVRRGAIVIFPSQISMFGQTGPAEALRNVQAAVRSALTELGTGEHAQPAPERFTVVGHGPGATLGLDYSAAATAAGLPAPGAVLAAFPSGSAQENLADIGAETRVVIVAGSGDLLNEDPARRLWAALTALPAEQRAYVHFDSDDHGDPPLEVWHYTPMASTTGGSAVIDALDWYGTWKLLDGLMQCAFAAQWCEYALGNTPEQRFMGTWSDGVPVAEARVLDEPGTPAPS